MKKTLFEIIIMVLLLSGVNAAEEYKVSSAAEIKEVAKIALPGDIIIMSNGLWVNEDIKFNAVGEQNKPIILRAETPGEVILTGSSRLRISGKYLTVDGLVFKDGAIDKGSVIEFRTASDEEAAHCRLTNSVIDNYNPIDTNQDYKWVSLYGSYNRVDHCRFENKIHSGCLLVVWLDDRPDYHTIDSNYFGPRPPLGYNGGEIVRVGTSHWSMYESFTTVENNYFERCNGEREIISNKSCGNVYRGNTFVECEGTLTLRHGNRTLVEGNFFFGNNKEMTGGVRIIGEDQIVINNYFSNLAGDDAWSAMPLMNGVPDSPLNRYFQIKNASVAYNLFVNNKYNIVVGVGADDELSLVPKNSIFVSNIFYQSSNPFVIKIVEPENFKWEGNIFFGSEPGLDNTNIIDPLLKKDTMGIYRVADDSPVVKSAVALPENNLLKKLKLKPWGWTYPIKKEDVGPAWK